MKKILSLLLAVIMVVSLLPVTVFATIYVDGESKGSLKEALVDIAQYVSADAAGDDLTVTGDVTGDGLHNSVYAAGGGEINIRGTVTAELDWPGSAIQASNDSTKVTVRGAVTEKTNGNAINASLGAAVEAGSVDEKNDGDAINAQSGAAVEVGKVSEDGDGNAVRASSGASVTVEGNVTESGEGNAIKATGAETMVTVEGNVKEEGTGSAINVQEATVIIVGNVEEANAGSAITATNGANVIVGGNVTEVVETAGASDGVISGFGATVIVEGLVTGDLSTNGQTNSGTIYLGQLNGNGNIKGNADLSMIHYLIGTAANSPAKLSDVTLVSDIVADGTIVGVNEKGYKYTTTADPNALKSKTITLKPTNVDKELTVSGFDGAAVTYTKNGDGSVTFTIGDSFTGGLQNLVLELTDKPVPEEPEPERRSYTTVTIGDRDDKEETKAEEVKEEENPDTGAPVMDLGAVAVVLGAAFVLSKKH